MNRTTADDRPVLVTGASGLLGSAVVRAAVRAGRPAVGLYGSNPVDLAGATTAPLDLADRDAVSRTIGKTQPGLVVHAAAWTSVDGCEADPGRAFQVNAEAAGWVAAAARDAGARTVYVSTDSVFDGERGGYTEADATAPLNVYAQSKLAGERAVAEADPEALLVRVNLYGWNVQDKHSLAEWVLSRLEAGEPMTGFDDVTFAPLLTDDLAEILLALADTGRGGLYHLASADALSKYAFALEVADVFGLDPSLVERGELGDPADGQTALAAPRPRHTALDASRARAALADRVPSWPTVRGGLERFRDTRPAR